MHRGGFYVEDFEILTTILSALLWRRHNGEIKLVTDSVGAEFYDKNGMCRLWNELDTSLDDIPLSINPKVFWAAGKIFALRQSDAPVAVMDTDFIVWDKLAFESMSELSAIHSEDINADIYPSEDYFGMKCGYGFKSDLDWSVRPLNAAFYIIKSDDLKKNYTDEAIEFMCNAEGGDELRYMLFAEQRLMPMCAKRLGAEVMEISDIGRLFENGERYFTHVWGMKQQMRNMPELRKDFCGRCIKRIYADFPEYADMLEGIAEIKKYL